MQEVIMSEQYQVAIPKEILDSLHLKVGQKFVVEVKGDTITLMPKSSIESFRGILKGANTVNIRDRSERIFGDGNNFPDSTGPCHRINGISCIACP